MTLPERDVESLLRPRVVAVIGASAGRQTQGNGVIRNLREVGYTGRIVPVHPTAAEIDGLAAVSDVADLPEDTDTAVIAIPAPRVVGVLEALERRKIRSAVVFSNGFPAAQEAAFRALAADSAMVIHGPNCMGLINVSDGIRLYPSTVTAKVRPGPVALIAQSGSAAISLMNSTAAGLSKVVTMGSEFQVTAPDYLRWLAGDDTTRVIGVVLESIRSPAQFAAAAACVRAAGKSLVVLKVGRSDAGVLAVQAHTGALISSQDAYDCFFAQHAIPTVRDYDELIASVECFAACRTRPRGARIGVVGISGGETALASDVAAELGVPLAAWSTETEARVRAALPGAPGLNPLDLGSTVHHTVEQDDAAITAILDDPAADSLLVIQDSQATLTPTMLNNYTPRILAYGRLGEVSRKPLVMVSPSGENTHPQIIEWMTPCGVPVLRGLRPGLVALRNLATSAAAPLAPSPHRAQVPPALRREVEAAPPGPLPAALCAKLLAAYDIPLARAAFARSAPEALAAAERIGFPLVLKIASPDIPHRSDVGGVARGLHDASALREALARMERTVGAARPQARIDGFEVQEEFFDHVEAMAGFLAAPPFGALVLVGSGGVLVEIEADRAVGLAPLAPEQAQALIARTRLGTRLGGYRNLMPQTDTAPLAALLARLSALASDFCDAIGACDLNPVLIRKETGAATVVDALLVRGRHDPAARKSRDSNTAET